MKPVPPGGCEEEPGEGAAVGIDPDALELRGPRKEFAAVSAARLERLEAEGETEEASLVAEARALGLEWLPAGALGGDE